MKSKVAELDGIRGIAILLVLLHHMSFSELLSGSRSVLFHGRLGVDLFFVLSGFLITGILVDSKGQREAIQNFYIRRILRIWPVYFITLLVFFTLLRRYLPVSATPWHYVVFIQNFSGSTYDGPFLHPFWSLAVEEQFYLVWPWVVLSFSQKALIRICAAIFFSALLFRIVFSTMGVSEGTLYVNTLCRMDAIAAGSMVAVWVRNEDKLPFRRFRPEFAALFSTALLFCLLGQGHVPMLGQLATSFAAIMFAWAVLFTWRGRGTDTLPMRILRSRFLTYMGRVSFTLYVINLPIYTLSQGRTITALFHATAHPLIAGILSMIVGNAALFLIAACSWKFFEKPILGLKDRIARHALVPSFATGD